MNLRRRVRVEVYGREPDGTYDLPDGARIIELGEGVLWAEIVVERYDADHSERDIYSRARPSVKGTHDEERDRTGAP